jgi:hypothetical protein
MAWTWTDGRIFLLHFLFFSILPIILLAFAIYICCIVITGVWVGSASLHYQYGVGLGAAAFWLLLWVSQERRTGWGNREGEGDGRSRVIGFLSILYLTVRFWVPVFHLYPVFTLLTLGCFGGLPTIYTFHKPRRPASLDMIVVRPARPLGSPRPSGNDPHVLLRGAP